MKLTIALTLALLPATGFAAENIANPIAKSLVQAINNTSVGLFEGKMKCGKDGEDSDFTVIRDDADGVSVGLAGNTAYDELFLFDSCHPGATEITLLNGKQPEVVARNYFRGGRLNESHTIPQIGDQLLTDSFSTAADDKTLTKVVIKMQTYVNAGTISQPKPALSPNAETITCVPYKF
jgi:hypothetical protein